MTQHEKRYPSGGNGNNICSKSNIEAVIDKNVRNKPSLLKSWTKVEISGRNYHSNRNFNDSTNGMFLDFGC